MKHKQLQRVSVRSKRPPVRSKDESTSALQQQEQDAGEILQRAEESPEAMTPEAVMEIQRIHGNRYASRLAEGCPVVQAKLTVGPANDAYEQEADNAAANAMIHLQRSAASQQESVAQRQEDTLQRQPEEEDDLLQGMFLQREMDEEEEFLQGKLLQREPEEEELLQGMFLQRDAVEEEELQAKLDDDALGGTSVGADVESQINSAKGGGRPLGDGIRGSMEGAFGADFSGVRVHDNARSDSLNRSVQAKAFTTGSDIFFSKGTYNPGSSAGQKLLAHELTHTIQQGAVAQRSDDVQREDGESIQRLAAVADFKNATSAGKLVKRKRIKQLDWVLEQYHAENEKPDRSYGLLNEYMKQVKDAAREYLAVTASDKKNKRRRGVQELLEQINLEHPMIAFLDQANYTPLHYDKMEFILSAYEWHNQVKDNVNFVRPNAAFEIDDLFMKQVNALTATDNLTVIMEAFKGRLRNLQGDPSTSVVMKQYLINTVNPILYPDEKGEDQEQVDFDPEKALTDYQGQMSEQNKLKENKIGSTGPVSGTIDTGKTAAFGGFVGALTHSVKEFASEPSTLTDADASAFRDSIKIFGSKLLGWATKGLSLLTGFGLIVKGIYSVYQRYKDYKAFKGTSKDLQGQMDQEQIRGVDESLSEHKSVKDIAAYAAKKVWRSLIWTIFQLVMNIGKFVSQVVALFTGGIAEIAALGFQLIKYAGTAIRKLKGFWKMVTGKRGKHRAENSSKLVDEALSGNKEALQLLVDLAPFGLMWKAKLKAKTFVSKRKGLKKIKTVKNMGNLEALRSEYPNSIESMYTYLRKAEDSGVLAEVKDHLFGVMSSQ